MRFREDAYGPIALNDTTLRARISVQDHRSKMSKHARKLVKTEKKLKKKLHAVFNAFWVNLTITAG